MVPKQEPTKPAILETDRKYYQDDSYYTDVAFSGTPFEKRVVLITARRKPLESPAVFVFLYPKLSLDFHG